jgi:hypothetical protein
MGERMNGRRDEQGTGERFTALLFFYLICLQKNFYVKFYLYYSLPTITFAAIFRKAF